MAHKRFTDINKWDDEWFTSLPQSGKLIWSYILDTCTNAGRWKKNFKKLNFCCDCDISEGQFKEMMDGRVIDKGNYYFIPKFLKFQYPKTLNSNKDSLIAVVSELIEYGLENEVNSMYGNTYLSINQQSNINEPLVQDTDTDTDTDKEKDTETETDYKRFVKKYFELHEEKYKSKPLFDAMAGKIVKDLLSKQKLNDIINKLDWYYKNDYWFNKSHDLKQFRFHYNEIIEIKTIPKQPDFVPSSPKFEAIKTLIHNDKTEQDKINRAYNSLDLHFIKEFECNYLIKLVKEGNL